MTRIIAATIIVIAAVAVIMWTGAAWAAAQCGTASWYGNQHHGRATASGEIFDQWGMTAAVPKRSQFGTYRVTYKGKSVIVRANDTGGFAKYGRIIDLSRGAARKLGMEQAGVGKVCMERL